MRVDNYIARTLGKVLQDAASRFPILTVIGPRQSGKTTLVRKTFPKKTYINFEDPVLRSSAKQDPRALLSQHSSGAIFDEIQHVPELLSYIQIHVDEHKSAGGFILTGSHQFELMQSVTQSLAGRTLIFKLLPLSFEEIARHSVKLKGWKTPHIDDLLIKGFYPRTWSDDIPPYEIYRSYFETYIEKDVRQIINLKDTALFQKFMTLCAGRVGNILNKESLARDVGINVKTVEEWLSALEASFVLFRLQPFHTNLSKRLVKSPKLYFYDVGLVAWLLRIRDSSQLFAHPLRGAMFENFIVHETMKHRLHRGDDINLFFYKDAKGNEIDLVQEYANGVGLIEIKASDTARNEYGNSLRKYPKRNVLYRNVVLGNAGIVQSWGDFKTIPWYKYSDFLNSPGADS